MPKPIETQTDPSQLPHETWSKEEAKSRIDLTRKLAFQAQTKFPDKLQHFPWSEENSLIWGKNYPTYQEFLHDPENSILIALGTNYPFGNDPNVRMLFFKISPSKQGFAGKVAELTTSYLVSEIELPQAQKLSLFPSEKLQKLIDSLSQAMRLEKDKFDDKIQSLLPQIRNKKTIQEFILDETIRDHNF